MNINIFSKFELKVLTKNTLLKIEVFNCNKASSDIQVKYLINLRSSLRIKPLHFIILLVSNKKN